MIPFHRTQSDCECMYTYAFLCEYAHMCAYVYECVEVCTHLCAFVGVNVCAYVNVHKGTGECVYAYG